MSKPIQNQVARLVWHANYSLKRSLSAVTNAAANAIPTPNPNYSGQSSLNKNWIHPPDALIYGRVEYTVKLLGDVAVDQAKGTDVIKKAIQTLRFNLSVKKSTGFKLQKIELHINVDGVNIVDAKTKMVLHKYPLHRISFCADDKTDKRLFAFIARQQQSVDHQPGNNEQRHHCYVFLSDKLAEEITLTIGEAFDLAYRRFLDNNGKDLELKKQLIVLRKRVSDLEMENAELKRQLAQQQRNISHQQNPIIDTQPTIAIQSNPSTARKWENFNEFDTLMNTQKTVPPPLPTSPMPQSPPVNMQPPPRKDQRTNNTSDIMQILSTNGPDVGRRLENLRLDHLEDIFDQEFDPRAGEERKQQDTSVKSNGENGKNEAHSSNTEPSSEDFELAISMLDSRLADMRDGFSSGISFGQDEFHLNDFDPLQNTTQTATTASVTDANRKTN